MPRDRFRPVITRERRVALGCWLVSGAAVTAEAPGGAGRAQEWIGTLRAAVPSVGQRAAD